MGRTREQLGGGRGRRRGKFRKATGKKGRRRSRRTGRKERTKRLSTQLKREEGSGRGGRSRQGMQGWMKFQGEEKRGDGCGNGLWKWTPTTSALGQRYCCCWRRQCCCDWDRHHFGGGGGMKWSCSGGYQWRRWRRKVIHQGHGGSPSWSGLTGGSGG